MTWKGEFVSGGWTPALRALSIELMDELLKRPAAGAICDPLQEGSTFRGIRENVAQGKYDTISDWKKDFDSIIKDAKGKTGDAELICRELDRWFDKRYEIIRKFSEFRFKDVTLDIVAEMEQARTEFAECK